VLNTNESPRFSNNVKPEEMAPMRDIKGIDLNKFEQFLAQLGRRIKQKRQIKKV